jgi:hypothetical protein
MSPADSNLMFSLPHSPSQIQKCLELLPKQPISTDLLSSNFSPSIFSPPEKSLSSTAVKSKLDLQFQEMTSPEFFNLDNSRDSQPGLNLLEDKENLDEVDLGGNLGSNEISIIKFAKPNSKRKSYKTSNSIRTRVDIGKEKYSSKRKRQSSTIEEAITSSDDTTPTQSSGRTWQTVESHQNLQISKSKESSSSLIKDVFRKEFSVVSLDQKSNKSKIDIKFTEDESLNGYDNHIDESDQESQNEDSSEILKSAVACNCKKSKCLKLYCDCFAILRYCDPQFCRCTSCCNDVLHEIARNNAIRAIKERNAHAFQVKINENEQHVSGCHCKNSHCLKKYCECFTANALCGGNCKCISCDNFAGSVELSKIRKLQGSSPSNDGVPNAKRRKDSPDGVANILDTSPGLLRNSIVDVNHNGSRSSKRIAMHNASLARQSFTMSQSSNSAQGTPQPATTLSSNVSSISSKSSANSLRSRSKVYGKKSDDLADECDRKDDLVADRNRSKNKKVRFVNAVPIVYPFFGDNLPPTSKLVALKVLDYLGCRDLYTMSIVNSLWSSAATDDALWE